MPQTAELYGPYEDEDEDEDDDEDDDDGVFVVDCLCYSRCTRACRCECAWPRHLYDSNNRI